MMSGDCEYDLMATRRKDPDYEQVSGYVHKDLALKFRIICTTERLTQSELLEEALKVLIELKNNKETDRTDNLPTETAPPAGNKSQAG